MSTSSPNSVFSPRRHRTAASCARARSALSSPVSRTSTARRSAIRSPMPPAPPPNACPDSRKCSRASSPDCFRWNRTTTKTCAKRSPNCASTTPRSFTSRKPRRRWVLASAAVFSVCCTWKSCRSGWSASTTSTSSPPRRRSSMKSKPPRAKHCTSTTRANCPPPTTSRKSASRSSSPTSSCRRTTLARSSACASKNAACRRTCSSPGTKCSCALKCR